MTGSRKKFQDQFSHFLSLGKLAPNICKKDLQNYVQRCHKLHEKWWWIRRCTLISVGFQSLFWRQNFYFILKSPKSIFSEQIYGFYFVNRGCKSIEFWFSKTGDILRIIKGIQEWFYRSLFYFFTDLNFQKIILSFFTFIFPGWRIKNQTYSTANQVQITLSQQYGMVNQNQRSWI